MTGLRQWKRDPELPARAGQPGLCALTSEEFTSLIERHLLLANGPGVRSTDWEYARWKPGVSITCTYRVVLDDGTEELVTLKRYAGDKPAALRERSVTAAHPNNVKEKLLPRVVLPGESLVLWTSLADRELGLRYLLDLKRLPKLLRDAGLVEPGLVRRRRTVFELLRYKPERRAVYRVDLQLRDDARTRFSLAARVLPPAEAARVAERRRAFEAAGGESLAPPLACAHQRHGVLIEPWIELEAYAPDTFAHAGVAGELSARLHALPVPAPSRVERAAARPDRAALAPLFALDGDLTRAVQTLPELSDEPTELTWVHGDFHPDQIARTETGHLLLDLDALASGAPEDDLASWIADQLFHAPDLAWNSAADPLLHGYAGAGGRVPASTLLVKRVASMLVQRGAAAIRRLESGALDRARHAVERSHALLGSVQPRP